jgi:hypothetical protein
MEITEEILKDYGFVQKTINIPSKGMDLNITYFDKGGVMVTFDRTFNLWILCTLINNMIYYSVPILYIKTEKELEKYYNECKNEKLVKS